MSDYSNSNATGRPQGRGQGGRRRRGGRPNRSSSSSSGYSTFKPNRTPQQTGFQKFLSAITFGLLGKPKARTFSKPAAQSQDRRHEPGPVARSDREARKEARPPRQQTSSEVTSERLYVGNLSYEATESDLFELFNGSGKVKNAEVVVNNHTQRSKGFAFVTMMTIDDAKKAVADLHNKEFMGRPLVVGGAKPLPEGQREFSRNRDERAPAPDSIPHDPSDEITRPEEDEQPA